MQLHTETVNKSPLCRCDPSYKSITTNSPKVKKTSKLYKKNKPDKLIAKKHEKICLWPSHIWYFSHVIIVVSNRALDSWSQAFPLRLPCKIFSPSPKSFKIFIVDYCMSSVWPIIVLRYTVWPRILNGCLWMDLGSSPTQVSICISATCLQQITYRWAMQPERGHSVPVWYSQIFYTYLREQIYEPERDHSVPVWYSQTFYTYPREQMYEPERGHSVPVWYHQKFYTYSREQIYEAVIRYVSHSH